MRDTEGEADLVRARGAAALAVLVSAALTVAACGSSGGSSSGGGSSATSKGSITVAAFNFPESQILANIYAGALAKDGYKTSVKNLTTRPSVIPAVQKGGSGGADVVPEYVGSFTEYFNQKQNGTNAAPKASSDLAKTVAAAKSFATPAGLTVLTPSAAADQNAFVVTQKFSTDNHVTKLSDLTAYKGKLVLGGPAECKTYALCQPGLEKVYGLKFSGFQQIELGGPVEVSKLKSGAITLGEYLSSDGSVKANDFVVLDDDKHLQNVDNVTPVINTKKNNADIDAVLDKVSAALTTQDLINLNAQVANHTLAKTAAQQWLASKGLG